MENNIEQLQFDLIERKDNNNIIYQRKKDGYVNATALCKAAGKRIDNYFRLSSTRLFVNELSRSLTLEVTALILIIQGGTPEYQGTWVHPQIAIHLAQWLSPEFAVKVSEWVLDWIPKKFEYISEDQKRLKIREDVTSYNKLLSKAANDAGVIEPKDHAIFQNKGYQGLYNGLTSKDIHKRKELNEKESILDHMGSTELAANLFRITQTEEKLRNDNINDKEDANLIHLKVGQKVRETIEDLGGTMPENLPVPDKSIKQIKIDIKKIEKKKNE